MKEVIKFWFEELTAKDWWTKNEDLDRMIEERFLAIHHQAIAGELYECRQTPQGRLAEIIVLDQFSRNIYRGDPRSFQYDPMAVVLSQECIQHGFDQELESNHRSFIYMPLMHSESLVIHDLAVTMFEKLGSEDSLKFEHAHRDIIKRFGRYPHRNQILGRTSTLEELEFLKGPGSSF